MTEEKMKGVVQHHEEGREEQLCLEIIFEAANLLNEAVKLAKTVCGKGECEEPGEEDNDAFDSEDVTVLCAIPGSLMTLMYETEALEQFPDYDDVQLFCCHPISENLLLLYQEDDTTENDEAKLLFGPVMIQRVNDLDDTCTEELTARDYVEAKKFLKEHSFVTNDDFGKPVKGFWIHVRKEN